MPMSKSFSMEPAAGHSSYKWVILLVGSVSMMFCYIARQTYGLLYSDLLADASSTQVTWIFNLAQFLSDFIGLFMPPLFEEFGQRFVLFTGGIFLSLGTIASAFVHSPEALFFTFSILTGLGMGLIFYAGSCKVPEYFLKQKGLATSLLFAGSSIGQLIGPSLVTLLQIQLGFFWTFLIVGVLFLNVCPLAMLFHPASEHEIKEHPNLKSSIYTISYKADEESESQTVQNNSKDVKQKDVKNHSKTSLQSRIIKFLKGFYENFFLLKSPTVVLLSTTLAIVSVTYSNFIMYIPFAMTTNGLTTEQASLSLTVTSFSMVVGRLGIPAIYDVLPISSEWYYKIGTLAMSICMLAFTYIENQNLSYVVLLIFGLTVGCTSSFRPLLSIELIGMEHLSAIYGLNGVQTSIFYLAGGTGLGLFAKAYEDYLLLIRVLAVLTVSALLLWIPMPFAKKYDKNRGFLS